MADERALFDAFSREADGYKRDAVIGAAMNVLANAVRQDHKTLGAAYEELDARLATVKQMLAANHYDMLGVRREQRIVLPSPTEIVKALDRV